MRYRRVRRRYQFIALLLLAVWLPVTQHCGLEAAGLLGGTVQCTDCLPGQPCPKDDCGTIESGQFKSTPDVVCVPAPMLSVLACLHCLYAANAAAVDLAVVTHRRLAETPRDWVPCWHFVRRTSPPSRAPSLLCA